MRMPQGGIRIVVDGTQLAFNPQAHWLTASTDTFWVNSLYLYVNK